MQEPLHHHFLSEPSSVKSIGSFSDSNPQVFHFGLLAVDFLIMESKERGYPSIQYQDTYYSSTLARGNIWLKERKYSDEEHSVISFKVFPTLNKEGALECSEYRNKEAIEADLAKKNLTLEDSFLERIATFSVSRLVVDNTATYSVFVDICEIPGKGYYVVCAAKSKPNCQFKLSEISCLKSFQDSILRPVHSKVFKYLSLKNEHLFMEITNGESPVDLFEAQSSINYQRSFLRSRNPLDCLPPSGLDATEKWISCLYGGALQVLIPLLSVDGKTLYEMSAKEFDSFRKANPELRGLFSLLYDDLHNWESRIRYHESSLVQMVTSKKLPVDRLTLGEAEILRYRCPTLRNELDLHVNLLYDFRFHAFRTRQNIHKESKGHLDFENMRITTQ